MAEEENIDRIEALNRKLFSKNEKLVPKKKSGTLHQKVFSASRNWDGIKSRIPAAPPMIAKITDSRSSSFFRKLFYYSLGFLALTLAFAFFVFQRGANSVSSDNIDISVLGNTFTAGGEDLQLQLAVTNKNSVALEYGDLIISYPKGANDATADSDFVRIREPIGTLGGGKTANKNIKVVLYGQEGSKKNITATLEYRIPGSNAIFTKEATYAVTISSAPLALSITAPKSSPSNQEITLEIKIQTNATKPIKNVAVHAEYPPGFQFKKAVPEPTDGSTEWNLGDIAPGMEKTITVTGMIFGQDNEERSLRFYAGESGRQGEDLAVIYSSLLHTIGIARPFIDARLVIGGADQPEYSIPSRNETQATVEWANNSTAPVENFEIRVRLSGNALDRSSVSVLSGFYNSTTNEVVWNANTTRQFASIAPGENGSLSFSFASVGLGAGDRGFIDNPKIILELSMTGTQTAEGSSPVAVNNAETKTIKVSSDLQVAAQAFYRGGSFTNTGPLPPKAETQTTYTIVWTINNTANAVSGAEVRGSLPTYIRWLGNTSPIDENVIYNDTTREVIWRAGQVAQGTGSIAGEREVSFQVALLSSLSQIGTSPELISDTTLTGTDTFTGVKLESKKGALSTLLYNDPGFPINGGVVIQ
ncbi:MAG: hypothetical protein MUD00_01230 [Candidatus Pacebacteria bacterium]|jgi:hypothetical protein|nr:hypothetical protein [Candidatus Paceibacterota bacterium]